ncbi:RidA family protein [Arvimicrobium flavum]|uniref:RidA family protein n=1 Tax=Arvimicrobium flavum TaxID=3393320 RepID=UPI00237C3524|nr:RidA family protein [Mesorhizobium shangrilense]
MSAPHQILQPSHWKPARGYSNGIATDSGRVVFLGGQIGWNAEQVFETDDFVGQTRQALQNILAILAEAGGGPEHIVRLTWFVTSKKEYLEGLKELGAAYREVMGRNFPTMSVMQVVALIEDAAKVEIEATAVLP